MKIMLLTPFYAIKGRKDLYEDTRAIHYFTKEWAKQGHEVLVVHTYFTPLKRIKQNIINFQSLLFSSSKPTYTLIDGVKIILFVNIKMSIGLPKFTRKQETVIKNEIQQILNNEESRPDIIIFHFPTIYLNLMKSLVINPNIKIVGVFHNLDIKNLNKHLKKFDLNFIKEFDGVGFRSNSIKKKFNQIIKFNKKEFMVYSGAPDKYLKKITYNNKEIKKTNKIMKILYVGKLIKRKNVDLILHALKKIDNKYNFEFHIIGEGPEKRKLIKLVNKLNIKNRVEFIKPMPREQVLDVMKKSNIFVMPSVNETFGIVYIEALASGCITIGTKDEGIDGIIKDNINGFLIKKNDVSDLIKKLDLIFNLPQENIIKIIENGYKTAEKYLESKVANNYLNQLKEILNYKKM